MKKLVLIFFAVMTVLGAGPLPRRPPSQGMVKTAQSACMYLSYYQEYYKQKNYQAALPNWRKAYALCPATASQNMFIHGTTLMTRLVQPDQGPRPAQGAIVDTILTLQDQRMAAYPKKRR